MKEICLGFKKMYLRIAISIFDADRDRDRDLNFGGRAHAMMKGESISPNFKWNATMIAYIFFFGTWHSITVLFKLHKCFLCRLIKNVIHMASKWNLWASWSFSRKSAFLSRQWRKTMIKTMSPQVPTKANPVSVILWLGVMKSLASHRSGSLGGLGITYIWELGIIWKRRDKIANKDLYYRVVIWKFPITSNHHNF